MRFLGGTIPDALSDNYQGGSLILALTKGVRLISNSGNRAVQKLWILQDLLVPHLQWPLLIYEIPISVVTNIEQKMSCCIRKWICLHNATTNLSLYSSASAYPFLI